MTLSRFVQAGLWLAAIASLAGDGAAQAPEPARPSIEQIKVGLRAGLARIHTLQASESWRVEDRSADWVKSDVENLRKDGRMAGARSKGSALYAWKEGASMRTEAFIGGRDHPTEYLVCGEGETLDKMIAKGVYNEMPILLQRTHTDPQGRHLHYYMRADKARASAVQTKRAVLDRSPLAFGYTLDGRPLAELLLDTPAVPVKVEGRTLWRVALRRPEIPDAECVALLDPARSLLAVRIESRHKEGDEVFAQQFSGKEYVQVEGVWLASEGVWETRHFKDRSILSGETETRAFDGYVLNEPLDLDLPFGEGSLVTNETTGQIFRVDAAGVWQPFAWDKRRPEGWAMVSGLAFLAGIGLAGGMVVLGGVRWLRRRSWRA